MRYFILILMMLPLWSCHQNNDSGSMALMDLQESVSYEEVLDFHAEGEPISSQPNSPNGPASVLEKKIIKTGNLTFKVEDTQQSDGQIRRQIKKRDAYIENESQRTEYGRKTINLTIRVKSTEFDSLFVSLARQSQELEERIIRVEDVTEQYYDLQARIKNQKALEERYIDLLKKANSVKDMLEIEKNLNQLRTEIEILEGKFRFLSKQVSYSTIHLSFYELLPYTYTSEVRAGFGERLKASLSQGWQSFLSFMVGLIGLWPFLLLLAVVIFMLRNWRRKRVAAGK